MDANEISPGQNNWKKSITDAVLSCNLFIVIVSESSKQSDWVRRELTLACQLKKPIIPILLDQDEECGGLPFPLMDRWLVLFDF